MRSILLRAATAIACSIAGAQAPPHLPTWLVPYAGSTGTVTAVSRNLLEHSYKTQARASDVLAHYQRIFGEAGVPWTPNFDGIGTSARAKTPECDLLIKVQEEGAATLTRVSCAAAQGSASLPGDSIPAVPAGTARRSTPPSRYSVAESRREHRAHIEATRAARARRAQNRAAGRPDLQAWPHAPENNPPPLVWPAWLVNMNRAPLQPAPGVNQSKRDYLEATFVSRDPMTSIHLFYEDLLKANGYRVHSSEIATGQTLSGVMQNAVGHVEGSHHPYDLSGPRTVIRVNFRRTRLNEPIRISIRMTAHPRF
ncbi:MAG: hypothetical protein IPM24_02955 [Bryobacterales bacterium]|nr:hypothetical protein [Bryobacterales bacterium]